MTQQNTFMIHVPATVEFNNTDVVCVVKILDGDERYSDPAVLRIQGMSCMCKMLDTLAERVKINVDTLH